MAADAHQPDQPGAQSWPLATALRVVPLPLWWLALRAIGAHDNPEPLWQVAGMVLALALGAAGAAAGSVALGALIVAGLIAASHATAGDAQPWSLLLAALAGALGPGMGQFERQGHHLRRVAAIALPLVLWAWAQVPSEASAMATADLERVAWTWLALLALLGLWERARHETSAAATSSTVTRRPSQSARIRLNPLLWLAAELGDAIAAWLLLPAALGAPIALLRLLTGRGAALAAEVGRGITSDLRLSPLAPADDAILQNQGRWVARQLAVGVVLCIGAIGPHGWSALGGGQLPSALGWAIAIGALATAPIRQVAVVGLLATGLHAAGGPLALVLARPSLQVGVRALRRLPLPSLRSLQQTAIASAPGTLMAVTLAGLSAPANGMQLSLELAAVLVVHAVASVAVWHLGVRQRH